MESLFSRPPSLLALPKDGSSLSNQITAIHDTMFMNFCIYVIMQVFVENVVEEVRLLNSTRHRLPQKKIIKIDELKDMGYSFYRIKKLVEENILKKLTRKSYENLIYEGDESDFYYVDAYVPRGVICLISSAIYWQLTTERSTALDVAIPRSDKIYTMPEWPRIQLYYYSDIRYKTGIVTIQEDSNEFSIYDQEKTVIDILQYRERLGIEVAKEVLVNYLAKEDRNLNKLYRYAKELRNSKTLRTYLEVLL